MVSADEARRLVRMAEAGIPAFVFATLLGDGLPADARRFLSGPLVVHESAWNESRPAWMGQQALAERVAIVFGVLGPDWIIGPSEVAAVMYGAALEASLDRDWSDLYVWAGLHAAAKHRNRLPEELAAAGDLELIDHDQVIRPDARLYRPYKRLADDVRRRVIALAERAPKKRVAQDDPAAPVAEQLKLF